MAVRKSNRKSNIQRARQIVSATKTPIQKANAFVGKEVPPVSPVKRPVVEPVIVTPIGRPAYVSPIKDGKPNREYIKNIPPPPPKPDPERPLPESPVKTEIDKIIEDSKEVIREIEVNKDPARPPVQPSQDIVQPPAAITPTELVLEAQANCEKESEIPNINIVNNFNPSINLSASATASSAPVITVNEALRGCTDPDALNYDPAAEIDDESCVFEPAGTGDPVTLNEPEPIELNIPETITFVDSHGAPLFEVTKDEVVKTEQLPEFGGIPGGGYATLPDGTKLQATLQLVNDITRPALEDSDIILTLEDTDTSDRKDIRNELGELASDIRLGSDEDIVIIGNREKIKKELTRNSRGIIFLDLEDSSKLSISLRSQAFNFNQYKRTIDTSFTELLGKR